jgi:hypothetical protein
VDRVFLVCRLRIVAVPRDMAGIVSAYQVTGDGRELGASLGDIVCCGPPYLTPRGPLRLSVARMDGQSVLLNSGAVDIDRMAWIAAVRLIVKG